MVAIVNSCFSSIWPTGSSIRATPSVNASFLHDTFLDKPLGRVLKETFYEEKRVTKARVGCEIVKELALGALTIAARIPYYQMCTELFPSLPGLGAAIGITGAVLPWGTIIDAFFHRLGDEWSMKTRLASAEHSRPLCVEFTKAALALTWGILAESYSFALVYLTSRRVELVALSAISVAIPIYSCNGFINWAWEWMTSTPQTRANKKVQELLQANLQSFINGMPRLTNEELQPLLKKVANLKIGEDELKEPELKEILRVVLQKGSQAITLEETLASCIDCLEAKEGYNPDAKGEALKLVISPFLEETPFDDTAFTALMAQLTSAKALSPASRKPLLEKALKEFLKKKQAKPASSISYIIADTIAYGYGVFLACVYLAWVAYLTYAGWKELPIADKDKERTAVSFGFLGALANSYFMYKGMTELCRSVPRFIEKSWNGTRTPSLIEKHYSLRATILKVIVVAVALMAFGPSTVISLKYLSGGLAIASTLFMSSASVLSPMEPMVTATDLALARIGRNARDPFVQEQFKLLKQLRTLQLALRCMTPSSAVALREFINGPRLRANSEIRDGVSEGSIFSAEFDP